MKKNIIFLLVMITSVTMFSCKKLLIESPKALTVEGFYNTAAEVQAGLAAIYEPIRNDMTGYWLAILETQTEWASGQTGSANFDSYRTFKGVSNTGENNLIPRWNAFYVSIRNANLVINGAPKSTVLTQAQKDAFVAEAQFLRAFDYFQLVRGWGGVPLQTEKNLNETDNIPKGSKQQIYDLITSDLEFAEKNLPDNPTLVGKPSKWAAKAFLSDVYLYQAQYQKAADKANEVIASGKYSLEPVTVADDFNKVFGMNSSSKEEIFYLHYNQNSPSQITLYTMALTNPWFGTAGYGVVIWTNTAPFYKEWNDKDLRKQFNWYRDLTRPAPWIAGQPAFPNEGILSAKKYNSPGSTISTFSLPCYRYAEVLAIYAEASAQAAGPTTDGVEKLNMIHRRAYGLDVTKPSAVDFKASDYTAKTFTDLVIQEKAYEFQLEGKRWFDLARNTTRAKEVIRKNLFIDIADKALLWPIPRIEFDLNKGLDRAKDQNPGY